MESGEFVLVDGRMLFFLDRFSPAFSSIQPPTILPPGAHLAAKTGKADELKEELENNRDSSKLLNERDEKGYTILHQGVTSGNMEVVELLIDHGAELNARTYGGYGETPLRIAEKEFGEKHPIVRYLKSLGALSLGPEL